MVSAQLLGLEEAMILIEDHITIYTHLIPLVVYTLTVKLRLT